MKNLSKKALYEQAYQEKLDILLMEGRKEDAFKKYASLGEDILETLADEDEDNNYKHLNWMAKQLIKIPDWEAYSKYGKEQEAELVINGLNKFLEYRPRLKRKDINQYKNTEEIYAAIDNEVIRPQIARSIKKRKADPKGEEFLTAGEATIVYEDDRYFVVRPDTMESSCYFGKKTRWCIAQPPNSYFDEYTDSGQKTFYFIKDEGMRDDDVFRKMAVQIGNETGMPVFEMFWDRFDDPYEAHATDADESAEFLTKYSGIPLPISEKIMEEIFDHAENNPPKPSKLYEIDDKVNDGDFNTKYINISSYLEDYPRLSLFINAFVDIEIPIKNKQLINLFNTNNVFVDWEGDRYENGYLEIFDERIEQIIVDKEKTHTDYKKGESFTIKNELTGIQFFEELFEGFYRMPSMFTPTIVFNFDNTTNSLTLSFGINSDKTYTDIDEIENLLYVLSDTFSDDLDLSRIKNVLYPLMPEAVTETSLIDKLTNILYADSKVENPFISIEEVDVNQYYSNLILSTNFAFSIKSSDEEDYIFPNTKEFKQVIQNISEDVFNETWSASVKLSKRQLKLNLGDKYKEPDLNVDMPNNKVNVRLIKLPNSPGDNFDFEVNVSSEIKFIDTEQEILSVYNFYKFIKNKYHQIKRILQKEINIYNESLDSELGVPMQEAKKKKSKSSGKKDACYHKVKSRYKVWPSAYASGALVKCRKVGAKNWGNSKKESFRIAIEDEISQVMLESEYDTQDLKKAVMKALEDEGGAAGMDALKKHTDAPEKKIKKVIDKEDDIQIHDDGDIIDVSGLEKIIKEEVLKYLLEKKKKRKKAGTESSKESSLRDWFGRKGAKGSKKGWVDCNAPDGKGGYKACGRSSGEKRKKYPACRPTPGACKERGKGKSWGKKAKKGK